MELTCSESSLTDQTLQDLAEAFQASHRLRQLTLCDVLPNMLCMASGISRLEELSLADICGKDTDLGQPLEVMAPLPVLVKLCDHCHMKTQSLDCCSRL